ncbi:MAG: hypothetical protein PUG12_05675 [Prevotella sp.]|nr:hypothetical protein [Prevotella sp.]
MKKVYQKPRIKVANIDGEVVMVVASVPQKGGSEKGEDVKSDDIGAKQNFFSDSYSSPYSPDEEEK